MAVSAVLASALVSGLVPDVATPQPAAASHNGWGFSVLVWEEYKWGLSWYPYYYNKCYSRPGSNRLVATQAGYYIRYKCYDVLA